MNKKEKTKEEVKTDVINSPFSKSLGWVKEEEKEKKLTKVGKKVVEKIVEEK